MEAGPEGVKKTLVCLTEQLVVENREKPRLRE
jgi:hypothetical protein